MFKSFSAVQTVPLYDSVVFKTEVEYPSLYQQGWIFETNVSKKNFTRTTHQFLTAGDAALIEELKRYEKEKLESCQTGSRGVYAVWANFEGWAYWSNGHRDIDMFPVFIKTDKDVVHVSQKKKFNRWDYMDV